VTHYYTLDTMLEIGGAKVGHEISMSIIIPIYKHVTKLLQK